MLSRRTFFSFFGTGVVMLAKPELFVPKPTRPKSITINFKKTVEVRFCWSELEKEWQFWTLIQGKEPGLLPVIPEAADGQALFSAPWRPIGELKGAWGS